MICLKYLPETSEEIKYVRIVVDKCSSCHKPARLMTNNDRTSFRTHQCSSDNKGMGNRNCTRSQQSLKKGVEEQVNLRIELRLTLSVECLIEVFFSGIKSISTEISL